jgi:hypothetical protein
MAGPSEEVATGLLEDDQKQEVALSSADDGAGGLLSVCHALG